MVKERQEESYTQTMVIQWSDGNCGCNKDVPSIVQLRVLVRKQWKALM